MKKKFLYLVLFALIITTALALTACSKPIEQPTPQPAPAFAFDAICEVVGEETYVVYENGMYYIASKEKGIISRPFYEYDNSWIGYANFLDCISVKLTATGSVGFMKIDGTLLSPLNTDETDFAYEGYNQVLYQSDSFENKEYISIFLSDYNTGKGQLLNTTDFNLVGDPYWYDGYNLEGNAYYGYVFLQEASFNEETRVYDFEYYLVNAQTGQKILNVDSIYHSFNNTNEDFGIEEYSLAAYQKTLPATDTEPEKEQYSIISYKDLKVLATNIKEIYAFSYLSTVFYGYEKNWNESLNQFNKIYFINSSLKEEEFPADIFYSRQNVGAENLKTSYTMNILFNSNGLYLYSKTVTDTENPAYLKSDLIYAKLGDNAFTTLSVDDGKSIENYLPSGGALNVYSTLVSEDLLSISYRITGFSKSSISPIFEYVVPFNTEEKIYSYNVETEMLGKNGEIAVTKLTLYENRFQENQNETSYLYIKKGSSPVVLKELPKDVSTDFYYVENINDVLVTLVETDTTHDTGFEENLCSLWLPLKGDFTNVWHRTIRLNLGMGLAFAEIIDFDKISIVEIIDNQSMLQANTITPYLSQIDFNQELIDLPNISETLNYNYYDTVDEDKNFTSGALVFSTDSEGYFNAYPMVNVNIQIPLQTPVDYNVLIYGEKGANGIYKHNVMEFPNTSSCDLNDDVLFYDKSNSYGSQKVTITEKEGGGLDFSITYSDYNYDYCLDYNDHKYFIIENKTNDKEGLLNEAGETLLAPIYDSLDYFWRTVNGVEEIYIITAKLDYANVYKIEGNGLKLIVDYGYNMIDMTEFAIIAVLPNGNAHVIDFDGNVLGEYDTIWFANSLRSYTLIDFSEEFDFDEMLEVESLMEVSTYCEQNQKHNRPQTFLVFTPFYYIVKSLDGYSLNSYNFCVEDITDITEINMFGGKAKGLSDPTDTEGFKNDPGYDYLDYAESLAFLKDGKFTPLGNLFGNNEFVPELVGDWAEDDFEKLYYNNFRTYYINMPR